MNDGTTASRPAGRRSPRGRAARLGLAAVVVAGCASERPAPARPSVDYGEAPGAHRERPDPPRPEPTEPELGEAPTLEEYLRHAALHNPGLRAAFDQWTAALERVSQAQALPDPRLSYGYYFREVETRVGAQRHSLGASQMLPWFGKLELRGDVAAQVAEERRERFEAQKLRLFYRVTDAHAEYYYLSRAIELTRDNIELLRYYERIARAKFRVATGRYPDVIKVQVELGKLEDRLRTLEDLRGPLVARLNEALGREVGLDLPAPAELPPARVELDPGALLEEAARENPELRALAARVEQQDSAIELAKTSYYPDVTFGVQWIQTDRAVANDPPDSGKDPVIGTLSINVPLWWDRTDAELREAEANRLAALHERRDRALGLQSSLQLAMYGYRDAERKIDLYRDGLLPKADEAVRATATAYQAGTSNILDLLDAQRVLLEFQLALERALASSSQRLAEIEMLVGRSLPRTPAAEAPAAEETTP